MHVFVRRKAMVRFKVIVPLLLASSKVYTAGALSNLSTSITHAGKSNQAYLGRPLKDRSVGRSERTESPAEQTKEFHAGSPMMTFGFLFPLISVAALAWAMQKNKGLCCADNTIVEDVIPAEIFLEKAAGKKPTKQVQDDIELQNVISRRADSVLQTDPVDGLSMLNQSDWTDDRNDQNNSSFTWTEDTSTSNYLYMKD